MISDALVDLKCGNLNRQKQAYKRLMTSLSHDVKTPLASLVGYLEAVENGLVVGEEKEAYIHVAFEKVQSLTAFVTTLFEWVKLDTKEQIFHFELIDIHELSRNVIADWIPVLEHAEVEYEIEIPESECMIRVDPNAYIRILNNLMQNMITHSGSDRVSLSVTEYGQQVKIEVTDNGCGIASEDLSHIFERMFQCDHSRSVRGNGLGLSIVKD